MLSSTSSCEANLVYLIIDIQKLRWYTRVYRLVSLGVLLSALPASIRNVFINLLGGTSGCMRLCLPFPLDTCHFCHKTMPVRCGGNQGENTFHNFFYIFLPN